MTNPVPSDVLTTLQGNEQILVTGIGPTGALAATEARTTVGAIAALASVDSNKPIETAIATVGNGVLTAAALVGGQIIRTGPVAAFSDATATAAAIVAAIGTGAIVGDTFQIRIKNGTAFTETLTAGVGVTLPLTILVPPLSVGNYFATVTNVTAGSQAVTLTHMSTTPLVDGVNATIPATSALTTVGNGTLLAAEFPAGYILRSGPVAAFTDTTDIATAIIAACSDLVNHIGAAKVITYINTTAYLATIQGATGITVSGITAVPGGMVARYLLTYTAAATLTMVGISLDTFNSDSVGFAGATSGQILLQPASVAGTSVLTMPALTDTLAVLNSPQTFASTQSFSTIGFTALTSTGIAALSTAALTNLNTSAFTTTSMNAITTAPSSTLTTTQVAGLTSTALGGLTSTNISALTNIFVAKVGVL